MGVQRKGWTKRQKLFLFSGLLASLAVSFLLDKPVYQAMAYLKNPIFDYMFGWFSHLGSIFVVLVIMASLFMWEERKREWIPVLLVSFALSLAAAYILKFIFIRPRPGNVELSFLSLPDYSFPSGHATASFSSVPVLEREFPFLKWFWVCFAVAVSFSRVYLGVHNLSDVVGGILLGLAVGELCVVLEEKYGFFKRLRSRI